MLIVKQVMCGQVQLNRYLRALLPVMCVVQGGESEDENTESNREDVVRVLAM